MILQTQSTLSRLLRILLLRPSTWTAIISIIAYWDNIAIHGSFVYDDAGSIKNNIIVNGNVDNWQQVFIRDFWGTKMTDVTSHKSFRPITTLSFKLNWLYAEQRQQKQKQEEANNLRIKSTDNDLTVSFHIVNYILHGIVTALVTEVAGFVFYYTMKTRTMSTTTIQQSKDDDITILQLLTGFFFGLHPLHVEAVSNLTSRGELLMSMFSLIAFLVYAFAIHSHSIQQQQQQQQTSLSFYCSLYIIPFICMIVSLFSKEQGATTLITLFIYDFIHHYSSLRQYIQRVVSVVVIQSKRQCQEQTRQSMLQENNKESTESAATESTTTTTTTTTMRTCSSSSSSSSSSSNPEYSIIQRGIILAIQTIIACIFRYWLNIRGTTDETASPDFIYNQNPAGFSSDWKMRMVNISYVWYLYVVDAIYPVNLCCDWSGHSITLIDTTTMFNNKRFLANDGRILYVLALWLACAACFISLIIGFPLTRTLRTTTSDNSKTLQQQQQQQHQYSKSTSSSSLLSFHHHFDLMIAATRRIVLISFFCFTATPFFLSSNIIVVIGLMKADRVVYLPLLGYCLIQAWLYYILFFYSSDHYHHDDSSSPLTRIQAKQAATATNSSSQSNSNNIRSSGLVRHYNFRYKLGYLLLLLQLICYCRIVHERNIAWSSSLNLWMSAYKVNPKSYHTIYNCGYELSLKGRYAEAEQVLRPIGDPHVDGPTNTFVYTMVLYNLGKCDQAMPLITDALHVVAQKKQSGGIRDTPASLARIESNLLVCKAYCTDNLALKGDTFYRAVQADPTNAYAVEQATAMLKKMEQIGFIPKQST